MSKREFTEDSPGHYTTNMDSGSFATNTSRTGKAFQKSYQSDQDDMDIDADSFTTDTSHSHGSIQDQDSQDRGHMTEYEEAYGDDLISVSPPSDYDSQSSTSHNEENVTFGDQTNLSIDHMHPQFPRQANEEEDRAYRRAQYDMEVEEHKMKMRLMEADLKAKEAGIAAFQEAHMSAMAHLYTSSVGGGRWTPANDEQWVRWGPNSYRGAEQATSGYTGLNNFRSSPYSAGHEGPGNFGAGAQRVRGNASTGREAGPGGLGKYGSTSIAGPAYQGYGFSIPPPSRAEASQLQSSDMMAGSIQMMRAIASAPPRARSPTQSLDTDLDQRLDSDEPNLKVAASSKTADTNSGQRAERDGELERVVDQLGEEFCKKLVEWTTAYLHVNNPDSGQLNVSVNTKTFTQHFDHWVPKMLALMTVEERAIWNGFAEFRQHEIQAVIAREGRKPLTHYWAGARRMHKKEVGEVARDSEKSKRRKIQSRTMA